MRKFVMAAAFAMIAASVQSCTKDDAASAKDAMGSAKEAAAGAMDGMGELAEKAKSSLSDLTKNAMTLSPEDLKSKMGDVIAAITKSFDTIKDKASATEVVDKLKDHLDTLSTLKTTLADKMPDMSALKSAVESLKTKFAGKTDILDALKPMFDKVAGLIGG